MDMTSTFIWKRFGRREIEDISSCFGANTKRQDRGIQSGEGTEGNMDRWEMMGAAGSSEEESEEEE